MTAITASGTKLRAPRINGHQTFGRALRSEWIKIRSLRSTWVTSAVAMGVMVLFGAATAIGYHDIPEQVDQAKYQITSAAPFGYIIVAVLGALQVTGEYASGQIRSSLTATPHRGRLLMAKAAVVAVFGFFLGLLSTMATWAVTVPFLKDDAGSITDSEYLGFFWGSGLAFAAIALMGLAYGFLLRSTAGAITVVVSVLFVVTVPLQLAASKWEWINKVIGCLPSTVSSAVSDPFQNATQWGGDGVQFLSHGQAIAVFVAWALVPLIAAWVVFSRRDA